MQELNDIINQITNETQRHANTKERIGKALTLLKNQVEKRVEKQDNKGLSTEDFTSEYKEKLERLQNVDVSHLLEKGTFEGTAQDLKTAIDDKSPLTHTHAWNDITNKPTDLATTQHVDNQIDKIQIGTRNHVLKSRITINTPSILAGGTKKVVSDPLFGQVVQYDRDTVPGLEEYQFQFDVVNRPYLNNKNLIYMVIAKPIGTGTNVFNFGLWRNTFNSLNQNSNKKELSDGWFCYWAKVKQPDVGQIGALGINSVRGSWLFYAVGIFETTNYIDWSPAPEDIQEQITALEDEVYRLKYATEHTANVLNINNSHIGRTICYKGNTNLTINVANMLKNATFSVVKTNPTAKILFTGKTIVADNGGITGGAYSSASVVCLGNEVVVLASNRS